MNPQDLAAALNQMDTPQAQKLAELLSRPSLGQIAAEAAAFSKRLDGLLPAALRQRAAALATDPGAALAEPAELPWSLRPGWRGNVRYLPWLVAILTAAGGAALLLATGGRWTVDLWTTVKWAGAGGLAVGLAVGVIVKIARMGDPSVLAGSDAMPPGAEMLGAGFFGLVVAGFLGLLWWLISGLIGITLVSGLLGLGLGVLLRHLLIGRRAAALQAAATQAMEAGQWDEAIARYERALRLHALLGDDGGMGVDLNNLGWCASPERNPAGDWRRAATCYAEAARRCQRAVARNDEANALINLADTIHKDAYPQRDAAGAAAACAQAAKLYAGGYERERQIEAVLSAAGCLIPKEGGSDHWEAAGRLYEETARLCVQAGSKKHGRALHGQAYCLIHGGALSLTEQARSLFEQAARRKREAGDEQGAVASQSWLTHRVPEPPPQPEPQVSRVLCAQCNKRVRVLPASRGKKLLCPHCRGVLAVPQN